MGVRDERREERRRLLLDTGMALLGEGGLDALTIAAVAEGMGASVGGLYRYFESKEAILVALQERAILDLWGFVEERVARAGSADATARLRAAFAAYLEHATERPETHELILSFLSAPKPLLSDTEALRVNDLILRVLAPCRGWIDEAVAAGELLPGDSMQRVHVLWALVHGLDQFRRRDRILPPGLRTGVLFDTAFDAVLDGWRARA